MAWPYVYAYYSSDYNCNDDQGHIIVQNPGYTDLSQIGWNDVLSSVACYAPTP